MEKRGNNDMEIFSALEEEFGGASDYFRLGSLLQSKNTLNTILFDTNKFPHETNKVVDVIRLHMQSLSARAFGILERGKRIDEIVKDRLDELKNEIKKLESSTDVNDFENLSFARTMNEVLDFLNRESDEKRAALWQDLYPLEKKFYLLGLEKSADFLLHEIDRIGKRLPRSVHNNNFEKIVSKYLHFLDECESIRESDAVYFDENDIRRLDRIIDIVECTIQKYDKYAALYGDKKIWGIAKT